MSATADPTVTLCQWCRVVMNGQAEAAGNCTRVNILRGECVSCQRVRWFMEEQSCARRSAAIRVGHMTITEAVHAANDACLCGRTR